MTRLKPLSILPNLFGRRRELNEVVGARKLLIEEKGLEIASSSLAPSTTR